MIEILCTDEVATSLRAWTVAVDCGPRAQKCLLSHSQGLAWWMWLAYVFSSKGKELFFSFFCFFLWGFWLVFFYLLFVQWGTWPQALVSLLSSVLYRTQGSESFPPLPCLGFRFPQEAEGRCSVSVFWIVLGRYPTSVAAAPPVPPWLGCAHFQGKPPCLAWFLSVRMSCGRSRSLAHCGRSGSWSCTFHIEMTMVLVTYLGHLVCISLCTPLWLNTETLIVHTGLSSECDAAKCRLGFSVGRDSGAAAALGPPGPPPAPAALGQGRSPALFAWHSLTPRQQRRCSSVWEPQSMGMLTSYLPLRDGLLFLNVNWSQVVKAAILAERLRLEAVRWREEPTARVQFCVPV